MLEVRWNPGWDEGCLLFWGESVDKTPFLPLFPLSARCCSFPTEPSPPWLLPRPRGLSALFNGLAGFWCCLLAQAPHLQLHLCLGLLLQA